MKNLQTKLRLEHAPLNTIYVSSYIPRKCGIATYTKDLTNAINLLNSHSLAEIMVMTNPTEALDYPWESKFKITSDNLATYLAAADYVNHSDTHLVSLQHEFGLFGGNQGEYILHFAESLQKPLITTFHTILSEPSAKQREVMRRLAKASRAVVVMLEDAADKLVEHYKIPRRKIVVIPHGVPDLPFNSSEKYKRKRQLQDRFVLGNINLLHPNKGVEYALEAVALLAARYPHILYVIIGQTHPELLRQEGEAYRNFLKKRVRELGIEKHVRFVNEYLPLKKLLEWLKALDMYITPYLDPQQITSGALAYAIGAGKACISTPYIYAQEVLAEGRGVLVPFRDPQALADTIADLHDHPAKRQMLEAQAYRYGRLMTWPNVAQSYLGLFRTVLSKKMSASASGSFRKQPDSLLPSAPG